MSNPPTGAPRRSAPTGRQSSLSMFRGQRAQQTTTTTKTPAPPSGSATTSPTTAVTTTTKTTATATTAAVATSTKKTPPSPQKGAEEKSYASSLFDDDLFGDEGNEQKGAPSTEEKDAIDTVAPASSVAQTPAPEPPSAGTTPSMDTLPQQQQQHREGEEVVIEMEHSSYQEMVDVPIPAEEDQPEEAMEVAPAASLAIEAAAPVAASSQPPSPALAPVKADIPEKREPMDDDFTDETFSLDDVQPSALAGGRASVKIEAKTAPLDEDADEKEAEQEDRAVATRLGKAKVEPSLAIKPERKNAPKKPAPPKGILKKRGTAAAAAAKKGKSGVRPRAYTEGTIRGMMRKNLPRREVVDATTKRGKRSAVFKIIKANYKTMGQIMVREIAGLVHLAAINAIEVNGRLTLMPGDVHMARELLGHQSIV